MSTQPAFITPPPVSVSDALLVAIFFAVIIHVLIIFSVSFSGDQPQKINKSITITIVNNAVKKAPKKADFLAQDNQVGAGEKKQAPKPSAQKLAGVGKTQKKKLHKNVQENKPKPAKKIITQLQSTKSVTAVEKSSSTTQKQMPKLSTDALVKQIAQLGAQIRYSDQSSELSRIKFVNSVSTHKYLAAQYIRDWQRKVERTGNMNYPDVARKKNFSGFLTMDVGIKHDGTIYSIRINKSSGIKALDDAAKRIVRMSAPFAPLPEDLRKELDVLVITRIWQFSDESGMTSK